MKKVLVQLGPSLGRRDPPLYAGVQGRVPAYAGVQGRVPAYAGVQGRVPVYAGVQGRVPTGVILVMSPGCVQA